MGPSVARAFRAGEVSADTRVRALWRGSDQSRRPPGGALERLRTRRLQPESCSRSAFGALTPRSIPKLTTNQIGFDVFKIRARDVTFSSNVRHHFATPSASMTPQRDEPLRRAGN